MRPPSVTVRVPAKVNLHLGVGPVRPDGFHELVTVFHAVDLCDVITARPASRLSVATLGPTAADVPGGPGNLAWRAAELVAAQAGADAAAEIEIAKTIPVAGGMAGGSADAAGTLRACARLWGVPDADLPALAAQLGSDVPFALLGGTALGTGRGEILQPLPGSARLHWVFALAGFGLSTAAVYRELDRLRSAGSTPGPALDVTALRAALASGDPAGVAAALHNDLQPAALELAPALGTVLDAGRAAGALNGLVSGSGATCAFLCADAGHATRVAERLDAAGVCRAVRTATGPAPGAAVVTPAVP